MKNDYEIRGEVTAIFLYRKDGAVMEAIIDTEDLEKVKEFPNQWYAFKSAGMSTFYVVANGPTVNGKRKGIKLHRYILNPNGKHHVDHINHDTLNNSKSNLRIVLPSENQQNRIGARSDNKTSGVRGVSWDKLVNKWRVQMQIKGNKMNLGFYECLDEAKNVAKVAYSKHMPYSEHARELVAQ